MAGTWSWGGQEFTLPDRFDQRALIALQLGNMARACTLLLGAEQTEALLAIETDEVLDVDALGELVQACAGAGMSPGESSASPAS